jgi:hypothetical protein
MEEYAEQQFRSRVQKRAEELGLNLRSVYVESGMSRDLTRTPISHRTIETVERLARKLGWSLAEVLGFSNRIDVRISTLAYHGAGLMMARMPAWARNQTNWIDAHATLYDLLVARREEGRLPDDIDECAAIVAEYINILVRAWETRPEPTTKPVGSINTDAPSLLVPKGAVPSR